MAALRSLQTIFEAAAAEEVMGRCTRYSQARVFMNDITVKKVYQQAGAGLCGFTHPPERRAPQDPAVVAARINAATFTASADKTRVLAKYEACAFRDSPTSGMEPLMQRPVLSCCLQTAGLSSMCSMRPPTAGSLANTRRRAQALSAIIANTRTTHALGLASVSHIVYQVTCRQPGNSLSGHLPARGETAYLNKYD